MIWFRSYLNDLVVFPNFLQFRSEFGNKEFVIWATVRSQSCFWWFFRSVAQSCPTLCDPMNRSVPGLPVHHQLLEFSQTHVHWVSDDIQPSHPLSSPSPAFDLSQHQGLFKWVSSAHQDSILKSRDITLPTNVHLVKATIFPVVMYGCESWTIKKAERQRIDAFELWCWRRLLRIPWTARRSNQSILKEISPGCSLEGLTLKLKLWPP